jgi:redox-sensitive bicupin YhaK (pirin superfamily)
MVIEGDIAIENEALSKRDAIGIFQTNELHLIANSNVQLLLIEVPMQL